MMVWFSGTTQLRCAQKTKKDWIKRTSISKIKVMQISLIKMKVNKNNLKTVKSTWLEKKWKKLNQDP